MCPQLIRPSHPHTDLTWNDDGRATLTSSWHSYVFAFSIIAVLVISLTIVSLSMERKQHQERARISTSNITHLLEQHLTDVFDKIDLVLKAIVFNYSEQHLAGRNGNSSLNNFLDNQQTLLPKILNIRITDKDGIVKFGQGVSSVNPVSLADRDFFIRAKNESKPEAIVFGPVLARISQQWVIGIARRLNNADGSFAGVVYANIATAHFEQVMAHLTLGKHGAATIRTTDLALVHRYPDTKGAIGSKTTSQQLISLIQSKPEGGEYTAIVALDGVERVNAYRRVERYPFYVIVGLSTEDFSDEWRTNSLILISLALITLFVAAFATLRLYRVSKQNATDQSNRQRIREQDAILNSNVIGVVVVKDHSCTWCNSRFAEMLGYKQDELLGQSTRIVYLNDHDYNEFHLYVKSTLLSGRTCTLEHQYQRKDGSLVWFEVCGQLMDSGGTEVIWSVADITQRKQTTEELAHQREHLEDLIKARTSELEFTESRMRLIIESSADGIIELDAQGTICMVNPAVVGMLGFLPEELIGRNVHHAIHYKHPNGTPYPAEDCAVLNAVKNGRKLRLDNDDFWHAAGHAVPVAVATHPIWQNDQVSGAVMSFFDNTERNKTELALKNARQAAEQLARLKSEFLANMSHEIRTPLNGVLGLAQIGYRDCAGRGKAQETFARIIDSGRLLLTIINDILDFSKIEAGKLIIEATTIEPGYLADDAISTIKAGASNKGINLVCESAPDLPASCIGDPVRISQILLNLLSNAVKFTAQGEVRLVTSCEEEHLVFRVTDTGIGISPDHINRMFMAFEQADGSTTRTFGGTGLGLAISRKLAEMMGGSLTATSEVEQGSTFTLRLPLLKTDKPIQRVKPSSAITAGKRLTGLRILVAEDNSVNQFVIEDFLTREGAEVTIVGDGRQAIQAIEQGEAFDVVLMDIQMPVMDGVKATLRLQQIAPALPIIGQTAHAMKEEHDRCLSAGMVATITKPIDIEILVSTVLDHTRTPGNKPAVSPLRDAASQPPTDLVVDWKALADRYPARPEFIDRLVAMAIQTHEGDVELLRKEIMSGDIQEIGKMAHTLKGLAGNIYAPELEKAAFSVMHAVKENSSEVWVLAEYLVEALARLLAELKQ